MNRDFLLCTASVLLAFGSSRGQETKHPDANVKAIKALSERLEQQTNRFENMRTRIQYEGTSIERIIQFAPVGKTVTKITSNAQTAKFKQGVGGYVFERTPIGPLQPSGLIGLPYASDFSSIYGVNSKYAFELTSKDPGKGYVLSRIVLLENDEVRAKENKRFSMLAVINPLKHYYHSEKRKIDALNDPKQSTIRSVTATDSICTLEYDMLMAPSLSFRTETVFDIPADYACKMKRVVRVPSTPNDPDIVSRFEYSKVNNEVFTDEIYHARRTAFPKL